MTNSRAKHLFDELIFEADEDIKRDTAIALAKELGIEFESSDYDLP